MAMRVFKGAIIISAVLATIITYLRQQLENKFYQGATLNCGVKVHKDDFHFNTVNRTRILIGKKNGLIVKFDECSSQQ